jgi:hypothetical protein
VEVLARIWVITVEKNRCQHVRIAAVPYQFSILKMLQVRTYGSLNIVSFFLVEMR